MVMHMVYQQRGARGAPVAAIEPRYGGGGALLRLPGLLSPLPEPASPLSPPTAADMKKIKRDWSKTQVHYPRSVIEI